MKSIFPCLVIMPKSFPSGSLSFSIAKSFFYRSLLMVSFFPYFIKFSKHDSLKCLYIVFHNTARKSPNALKLSVTNFLTYVIKPKKMSIFTSQTGTWLIGGASSFSSKTIFFISCLADFLSLLSLVRYNHTVYSSCVSSFRIS